MNKNDLYETIKYFLIIIFLILVVVFRENMKALICVAGVTALLVGIVFVFQKKTNGLLVLSLGISILSSFALYTFKVLNLADAIIFLLTLIVILTFMCYLLVEFVTRKKIYATYTIKSEARVIDLIKNKNTRKDYYKPLCEYEVDGKVYEALYPYFKTNFIPKIGDVKMILINPNDHNEIYFFKDKIEDIKSVVVSLFFVVAALIIMVGLF